MKAPLETVWDKNGFWGRQCEDDAGMSEDGTGIKP